MYERSHRYKAWRAAVCLNGVASGQHACVIQRVSGVDSMLCLGSAKTLVSRTHTSFYICIYFNLNIFQSKTRGTTRTKTDQENYPTAFFYLYLVFNCSAPTSAQYAVCVVCKDPDIVDRGARSSRRPMSLTKVFYWFDHLDRSPTLLLSSHTRGYYSFRVCE